jgi:hypothetical protein
MPDIPVPGSVSIELVLAWAALTIIGALPFGWLSRVSALLGMDVRKLVSPLWQLAKKLLTKTPPALLLVLLSSPALEGCGASVSELNDRTAANLRATAGFIRDVKPEQQVQVSRALGIVAECVDADFVCDGQILCGAVGSLASLLETFRDPRGQLSPDVIVGLRDAALLCQAPKG